jgi:hypothetical protein
MRRFAKPLYGLTPVPRVRIPPSPPVSLSCREFPSSFPAEFVNSAHILQSLPLKPDCGERTAVQPPGLNCGFFSEGQMSSPTLSTFVRRRQGDQRSNSLRTPLDFTAESACKVFIAGRVPGTRLSGRVPVGDLDRFGPGYWVLLGGKVLAVNLTRDDLLACLTGIRAWCNPLATSALAEFNYDGFG